MTTLQSKVLQYLLSMLSLRVGLQALHIIAISSQTSSKHCNCWRVDITTDISVLLKKLEYMLHGWRFLRNSHIILMSIWSPTSDLLYKFCPSQANTVFLAAFKIRTCLNTEPNTTFSSIWSHSKSRNIVEPDWGFSLLFVILSLELDLTGPFQH